MRRAPRVALFADTFHEVNGAAHTCRQLDAFARRRGFDFLNVHCGPEEIFERAEPHWTLQLKRGPFAFRVDRDLSFDPCLFLRRRNVLAVVRDFAPDLIHVTSTGDVGILGMWAAHRLRVPVVASWHTNVHEFAARRLEKALGFLPRSSRTAAAALAERWILRCALWFYGKAQAVLAPNQDLARVIAERTGRPVFLMTRGIDTGVFSPAHREREGGPLTIGFVGRLTPEKNVRLLARLEETLVAAGAPPFRLLVVGDGSERAWLQANLRHAEFPGVLRGRDLSRAYAGMDVFAFPSHTDTYGNVVLEAMASGVPAVVTADGGPKFLVRPGETGFVAAGDDEFLSAVRRLALDAGERLRMGRAARAHALQFPWDHVFETEVYATYRIALDRLQWRPAPGKTEPGNRSFTAPSPDRSL